VIFFFCLSALSPMSHHRHLPIWKAAMALAVHLEGAVRRFSRYHKYTLAQETQAFAHFNEFALAAEWAVDLGKQSGGWRRRVRSEASPSVV
jgi:hypothetical protein